MPQTKYTYSVATDTANAALAADSLKQEYENSSIVTALDYISSLGDVLDIYTKDALSTGDKTTLDSVIAAHTGVALEPDPAPVKIAKPAPAFADKLTPEGKSLFAREQGIAGVTVAAGATEDIIYTVAYPAVKINGAAIFGCQLGDTVNFKVLDSTTGTYTTVPNYQLNQFGYNVNMPADRYEKQYPYDADLYTGMQVKIEYTNNGGSSVTIYVNLDVHEVKD